MSIGNCAVRRLNKTGNYFSKIDSIPCFADKDNPKGFARWVIHPIHHDGINEIRYMKTVDGYIVSGECYIVTGTKTAIMKKCRDAFHHKTWDNLVHTYVTNRDDLW